MVVSHLSCISNNITANGLGLCEGRAIELQNFNYSTNDR